MTRVLLRGVLLAVLLPVFASAGTIYVNGTTGDDAWTGLCETWDGGTCGPKKTIQAGIDAAQVSGDTILVEDGLYVGAGNTDLLVANKSLTLSSRNGAAACTIDVQGPSPTYGINVSHETSPFDVIIQGFTIRHAYYPALQIQPVGGVVIRDCVFEENDGCGVYAQVYVGDEDVQLVNCVLRNNELPIAVNKTHLRVRDCLIDQNHYGCSFSASDVEISGTLFTRNVAPSVGGAIYCDSCANTPPARLVLESCQFEQNHAWNQFNDSCAGALSLNAPSDTELSAEVRDCVFRDNTADIGGAVAADTYSGLITATFVNCVFTGNVGRQGGAVHFSHSATFTNCIFAGNFAFEYGGAAFIVSDELAFNACTIAANEAGGWGGGIYSLGNMSIRSSILWGNSDRDGNAESSQLNACCGTTTVGYSCIENWTGELGGVGNHGSDPLFVDPANGDYRLSVGSPCIDAGDNAAVGRDELDVDGDDCLTELLPVDLGGDARFCDNPATPDTGYGEAPIIDMGTYEYGACAPPPSAPCPLPGDLNCDGSVSFADINPFVLILSDRAAWTATYPDCPVANGDIDGDSIVGFGDINPFVALLTGR